MKVLLQHLAVAAITMHKPGQRPPRISIRNMVTPPRAEAIAIARTAFAKVRFLKATWICQIRVWSLFGPMWSMRDRCCHPSLMPLWVRILTCRVVQVDLAARCVLRTNLG
ncbi:hypothetical protein RBSH_01109 [Rhodopirellula baltica SH28]|uniref:Uncharacterized protein n=1 Tax=Rhodopirellula baltica SH28 TaxID=993517 RepID=K5CHZ7_RHOBT|nr:hypothetical protein RBSH_01109 [Rhodopirellula baltica SH28]